MSPVKRQLRMQSISFFANTFTKSSFCSSFIHWNSLVAVSKEAAAWGVGSFNPPSPTTDFITTFSTSAAVLRYTEKAQHLNYMCFRYIERLDSYPLQQRSCLSLSSLCTYTLSLSILIDAHRNRNAGWAWIYVLRFQSRLRSLYYL